MTGYGFLEVLTLIALSTIVYTDFRYRYVYLTQIVALYLLFAGMGQFIHKSLSWVNIGVNFIFLGFQMNLAYIWIRRKGIDKTNSIVDHQIGLGDILIIPAFAFGFEPMEFIWSYAIALVFTLIIAVFFIRPTSKTGMSEIPLAGGLSLFYCFWLLLKRFYPIMWL